MLQQKAPEGILLVNKPRGVLSFSLVSRLRKLLGVRTIGHAGTLDPFATGVMVMLIGRKYTQLSNQLLAQDKEYVAEIKFGEATDTYDCEGAVTATSDRMPTHEELVEALKKFQGEVEQVPPMYSAKKVKGKKLYELARQGKTIERASVKVRMQTVLLSYSAPYAMVRVECSKGTYIRSVAHDLGQALGCGAHLTQLERIRSGAYRIDQCVDGNFTEEDASRIVPKLIATQRG